jgi:hypothetical protein
LACVIPSRGLLNESPHSHAASKGLITIDY